MYPWPQKVTDTRSEPQKMLAKPQDVEDITFEPQKIVERQLSHSHLSNTQLSNRIRATEIEQYVF